MSVLTPLHPIERVPVGETGVELQATQAGRTSGGLRASIDALNGTRFDSMVIDLNQPKSRAVCVQRVRAKVESLSAEVVEQALVALCERIEGQLRKRAARRPRDLHADNAEDSTIEIEVANRFRHEITADCMAALKAANGDNPTILRRGTEIVRVHAERPAVERLNPVIGGVLDRTARFMAARAVPDGGEYRAPARPPRDVVLDLMALPNPGLPELLELRAAPVFVPPGRLLSTPGYDSQSRIYLAPTGLEAAPRDLPADEALHLLREELLGDFPFADDPSVAHALALLLLPFVRPMIDGPTPLHLIDAPARGTGKGLLTDVVAIVALGGPAEVMAPTQSDDELEKRITALLVSAAPILLLDNITRRLDAAPLAAVLTTVSWRGRILGESRMVTVPNTAIWFATGNNVELSDELVRRTIPIRLDAGVERPEERTGWRHPDLTAWTRVNRPALVDACLVLVRCWMDAGMPPGKAILGRFEGWAQTLGGILSVAGVPGFLGGRERLHAQADRDTQEWAAFCQAWWDAHAALPVSATDLFAVAKEGRHLLDLWGGRSELPAVQRLGHALQSRRDHVFGGIAIRLTLDAHAKTARYRLERPPTVTPQTPQTPQTDRPDAGTSCGVSGPVVPQTTPNPATLQVDASTDSGVCGVCGVCGDSEASPASADHDGFGTAPRRDDWEDEDL